jgi:hypothetical protein
MKSTDETVGSDAETPAQTELHAQGPAYKDRSNFPVPDLRPLDDLTPPNDARRGWDFREIRRRSSATQAAQFLGQF